MPIQLNDTGDYVKVWQRICHTTADGTFGPNTDAVIRAWQSRHGVDPDGVVGPLTRAALDPSDLIKPYEGLRLQTYDDHDSKPLTLVAGVWRRPDGAACIGYPTIGWGRRLWPGENIQTCTKDEADGWIAARLKGTELPAVERAGLVEPGQRCAACTFAYNCGTGAFAELAKNGFAESSWLAYDRTKGVEDAGLKERRREEYALFVS